MESDPDFCFQPDYSYGLKTLEASFEKLNNRYVFSAKIGQVSIIEVFLTCLLKRQKRVYHFPESIRYMNTFLYAKKSDKKCPLCNDILFEEITDNCMNRGYERISRIYPNEMKFQWPKTQGEIRAITKQQLQWLLDGLQIHRKKALKENVDTEKMILRRCKNKVKQPLSWYNMSIRLTGKEP